MKRALQFIIPIALVFSGSCKSKTQIDPVPAFTSPQKVTITGYSGNTMEPFLTRDGTILFFNNLNSAPENTNLHWSTRINDSTFQYKGELIGVNTPRLEAVATMDSQGIFYFVSDRDYNSTLASVFVTVFSNGSVGNALTVGGISRNLGGWLNFDVEVDASGEILYFVDGRFDQAGGPYEADFVMAGKTSTGFERFSNSAELFKNINTTDLEYAAGISKDNLEFYFTRVAAPLTSSSIPEIFRSRRNSLKDPFDAPTKIESITGFAEAPTVSPDGKILYFHKKVNGKFVIYLVRKM